MRPDGGNTLRFQENYDDLRALPHNPMECELNKSILLIPCLCGELTQDLVAEALTTVRVQDVTTWVSENVGETMQAKRRREFPRSQSQKPGAETAEPLADTG
jgi:hypothetical protein